MTGGLDTAKYQPLLDEAMEGFREDPEYTIAVAKQAGILLSKSRSSKLTKDTSPTQDR